MIGKAGTSTQIERDDIFRLVFIETRRDERQRLFNQFGLGAGTGCCATCLARACCGRFLAGRAGGFQGCGALARGGVGLGLTS